jgi:indolepyruvate ferredoxin oxidoreductase
VLSFVRVAPTPDLLNQVRIDTQQADVLLACDMVVGASADALGTVKHGRTVVLANTHELATAAFVRNPDASLQAKALLAKLLHAAGDDRVSTLDAQGISQRLMGDTMPSNIVMLGAAFQRGLVPVSEAALLRAIELNGVAIEANKIAFALGRLAAIDPSALDRLAGRAATVDPAAGQLFGAGGLVERRMAFLTDYQDEALARRYRSLVDAVHAKETALGLEGTPMTEAVARQFSRLLAIKDEYEVARLYTDGRFQAALAETFEAGGTLTFHLAPPLLARPGPDGRPRKMRFGPWMMTAFRWLAKARRWRGSWLDPFGHTEERKLERQLADDYEHLLRGTLLPALSGDNHAAAVALAKLPERIRGYGHVKLANVATARAQQADLLQRFASGEAPAAAPAPERKVIAISAL